MGLFIGASILTVLELFDYAYEVSVSAQRAQVVLEHRNACVGRGAEPMSPHGAGIWLWQVIKHRLCRRGKCHKNHKRNNTDKGVALSMDDVKRHVSARHVTGAAGPPTQPRRCHRCAVGWGSPFWGPPGRGAEAPDGDAVGSQDLVPAGVWVEPMPPAPRPPSAPQNPCESIRGHPAGMTYAANILPHHPARGTFEDFTC